MKKFFFPILLLIVTGAFAAGTTRSKKADISRNLSNFNSVYKELQTYYVDSIDAEKSINTAITAMLRDIDPYTEYIPQKDQESFKTMTTGEYGGIGSLIMQRDGGTYIDSPYKDSPAAIAGLRPGDHIIMINGDTVAHNTSAQVSEKLRGPAGSKLKVTVDRPYVQDSILTFDITRKKIQLPAVPYYGMTGKNTGYIALNSFTDKSFDEVKNALTDLLKNQGAESIILDLRGNGGGLLESAVQILGLFLPKNTQVLVTRGQDISQEQVYKTQNKPVDTKVPLVVLIDGGSASSAEIVTGALQDLDRAVVIGSRSYGKGLVQTTRPVANDGLLKVTVSKYYIPSGRLIQAIDYSHRTVDGQAQRIPDSLTTEFRTANGRIVRDGGGITPDIEVKYPDVTRLAYNAVGGNWVFDFANQYRATHDTISAPEDFEITDSLYAAFKSSIDPKKFNYDKVCETILEQLKKAAEIEGYMNDSIAAQIDDLGKTLHHDLDKDLDVNRELLSPYIAAEILERYYFDRGPAIYNLKRDKGIKEALDVLENNRTHEILKGQ